jgi:ribosomal protein S18 acetylase RimI-like enzyme
MLRIYRTESVDAAAFDAILGVYTAAIERSEQKTEAELRAAFGNPHYRFLAAADDGAIVGFSIVYAPPASDMWVLEYLAVAASHEGQGIGGDLLAASIAEGGGRPGLLEVDSDVGENSGAARRRRRQLFYSRAGCRRLGDIAYRLPLEANGPPPPMDILVHAPDSLTHVPLPTVRTWLTRLYVEVYGQKADDPRIGAMLASLSGDVPLHAIWS